MMSAIRALALAAPLAALLAGCAGPAPPKDAFWRLEVAEPARHFDRPPLPGVLEVDRLETDGVVGERALAFSPRPGGPLERYRYDFWSEPPGILLQDRLARSLRAAGAAAKVVTPDLRVPPDWTLRGKIRRFEQIAATNTMVVELQLAVVSARDGSLVLLETYSAEVPAPGGDVAAVVDAAGRAVSTIIDRFLAQLGSTHVAAPARP